MHKAGRLIIIERILNEERISSQAQLLKKLKGKGIICTQATLSRNLRQLGVSRITDGTGGYFYTLGERNKNVAEKGLTLNILPVIIEIIEAGGLFVIKTIPGNANSTAYYIDNSERFEIAGTIAGDDTILVIPRDGITVRQVHDCLELILPGLHDQLKRRQLH